MQVSQASKAVEKTVEENKQSPKNSYTEAERSEPRRKSNKAALEKLVMKAMKRSKNKKAKPIDVPLNEVAETTTSTEPQIAEESSTNIEASAAGKSQETLATDGKEANDNHSKGKIPTAQGATAQKVDDITDILKSSKKRKMPKTPVKAVLKARKSRKAREVSTNTKKKAAETMIIKEDQKSGESPDANSRKTAAMIASYSNRLLAHLKANPEETSRSIYHLKVVLHISSDFIED